MFKKKLLFGLLGAVIVIILSYLNNAFIASYLSIMLGFFILGFGLPDYIEEWAGIGYTLWVPLAFVILGTIGVWIPLQGNAIAYILSTGYCGAPPCVNFGMLFLSFVIGDLSLLASRHFSGKQVKWFG